MWLKDILPLMQLKDGVSIGGLILILILTVVQITPIKWNPWDRILSWVGDRLNTKVNTKIDDVNQKVDDLEKKLDAHVSESEARDLKDTRKNILDFANSCMYKRKHTKEQFDFVIKECDDYEIFIETNHIKNGVISSAIREIRRLYDICIQENSFLKEGEDPDD